MSYRDYVRAMELASKCKFYTTVGGRTEDEIIEAERILGLKFSKQCRDFYGKYGYLSFFGNEIYGIDPYDDSGVLAGNSVAYAMNDREECGLPKHWIPIYDFEDGEMAYLDYSYLNEEEEPRVIQACYDGEEYEIIDILAEDFGSFVLQLVLEQLEG